jgi:hypothetical protein
MAKRLTDTEKWRDDWFGSLSNDYRIIWLYLIDSCTHAGVWKKDFRGLNFNCNTSISEAEILEVFGSRLVDCGNFFFIPKFIKFQYSQGLGSNKPVIVSVVKELKSNNLYDIIKKQFGNDYLIIKDKSKDKSKSKDIEKEKEKKPEPKKFNPLALIPEKWNGDLFEAEWDDFMASRKKKGWSCTPKVLSIRIKQLRELSGDDWGKALAMLQKSTEKGYAEFFAPDNAKKPEPTGGRYDHERNIQFDKA